MLLTHDGDLHLYVDGQDQGIIMSGLSTTQHAAFQLDKSYVKQVIIKNKKHSENADTFTSLTFDIEL